MFEARDLTRRYGARTALDGLTLSAQRGEVLGLLGPNGAGKSTLMHLVAGLLAPDAGTVRVDGGDPREPATRRKLGIAPQSLSLYAELSAEENLAFCAELHGLPADARRARVEAALAIAQLEDRRRERVGRYSGGMQRRLNLACAIVHEPALVLLDEPTVGVDPQSRNALFDAVRALRARGCTVLYSTHYMEEAEKLCDRVAVVDHGRLLALDTPAALVATHGGAPVLRWTRDGVAHARETRDPVGDVQRLAAEGGFESFQLERPTLEQVFLGLTGRSLRDA